MQSAFIVDSRLLVYEGFQYVSPGNNLIGTPDGDPGEVDATGLTGTWSGAGSTVEVKLQSGSLAFGDLPTSGNSVASTTTANQGNYNRTISADLGNHPEIWFSFIVKHRNMNDQSLGGFAITTAPLDTDEIKNNNTPSFEGFGLNAEGPAMRTRAKYKPMAGMVPAKPILQPASQWQTTKFI